ncbi:MAG: DUF72 domain-containing protein [Spirochaetaceae bacterium]|nr:MAG: DUF72 domain-containing protein [Spirochaetaceae bacterium]
MDGRQILIGTSGYSYDDWVGPFYPEGMHKRDFLGFYASEFPVVELNFSYYTQPTVSTLQRMIEKTPAHFRFAIKAHQSLTHTIPEDVRSEAERYKQGIQPLVEADRLAAVLFQFPYSFHYTPECRKHLQRLCESFADLPKAVEFRNSEWQKDSVYHGLREADAAYVNVDEPRLPKLPEPTEVVSSDLAYLRFHGRNQANWWKGDNVSRYDYLYDGDELSEWLPMIERMLAKARLLLVIFNNHSRGQAIRNARELQGMLFP